MKFEVYSLKQVLKVAEDCPGCNLLSIRDPFSFHDDTNSRHAGLDDIIQRNGINAKVIYFDDIDPYRFYHDMEHPTVKAKYSDTNKEPVFFTAELAKEIVLWVMEIWKKDHNATVKVHCWAGRSRSQAVAYWLNMYFNLILERNLPDYYANNALNVHPKVHFNCEVLRVFTEAFG